MDWKIIAIIVLIVFIWYSYNNPVEGKALIDKGVDATQALVQNTKGKLTNTCPTNYDPICAAGTVFDNSCLAQKAGHTNMTAGVC